MSEDKFSQYFKFMHSKSKEYRKYIPLILICNLIFSIISILTALIGKQLIDNLLSMEASVVIKVVCISISAFVIGAAFGFGTSILEKYVVDKVKVKMQLSFYDNMQKSDFVFFSTLSSSDIYYRMFIDIGAMVDFYLNLLIAIPIKILVFIVSVIIMLSWSWQLTIAIIGLVFVQLIIMLIFRKPIKKRAEVSLESEQSLLKKINEDVLKSDACRSLALEKYNYNNIIPVFETSRKNKLKSAKLSLFYSSIVGLISQILNVCLLLLGIFFVSNDSMTIGMLMGISMLAGYVYTPLNDLFKTIISYQPTKVSFNRFREFDSQMDKHRYEGEDKFIPGDIIIENVSFSYGYGQALKKLDAKIVLGEITHIKGKNGTGKTTLMRLLTRFFPPQSGAITINNVNIYKIQFDEYRHNVVNLSADPVILNGTFKDNLQAGKEFTTLEINEIITYCGLANVVENLQDGLNTIIGTGNAGLSKGEMQKLVLARVLLRKPKVIILDEPLSHVDINSVDEILTTLQKYNMNYKATIVIISHDIRVDNICHSIINL